MAQLHDLVTDVPTDPPTVTLFLYQVLEDRTVRNRPKTTPHRRRQRRHGQAAARALPALHGQCLGRRPPHRAAAARAGAAGALRRRRPRRARAARRAGRDAGEPERQPRSRSSSRTAPASGGRSARRTGCRSTTRSASSNIDARDRARRRRPFASATSTPGCRHDRRLQLIDASGGSPPARSGSGCATRSPGRPRSGRSTVALERRTGATWDDVRLPPPASRRRRPRRSSTSAAAATRRRPGSFDVRVTVTRAAMIAEAATGDATITTTVDRVGARGPGRTVAARRRCASFPGRPTAFPRGTPAARRPRRRRGRRPRRARARLRRPTTVQAAPVTEEVRTDDDGWFRLPLRWSAGATRRQGRPRWRGPPRSRSPCPRTCQRLSRSR